MTEDPHIAGDFDELFDVIGDDPRRDPWEALVNNAFSSEDLVFAIIEHVTIGKIAQVGSPYIYYRTAYPASLEQVRKDYKKIVAHMKLSAKGGPSAHLGWYMRTKSFRVTGTNPGASCVLSESPLPWSPRDGGKEIKVEEYILHRESKKLDDSVIEPYLRSYVGKLKQTHWFTEAAHYFIVVKPISVHDRGSATGKYMPLGNLYLHFGTNSKHEPEFFRKLVGQIVLVWLRSFGYRVVSDIKLAAQNELDELFKAYRPLSDEGSVPQRKGGAPARGNFDHMLRLALGKWYKMYGPDVRQVILDVDRFDVARIAACSSNKRPDELESQVVTLMAHFRRWKLDGIDLDNDEKGDGLSRFGNMMNMRRLALILLIVVGRNHTEVRDRIRDAHRNPGKATKERSAKQYLLENFDISMKHKSEVYVTMSPSEKKLVDELLKHMPSRGIDIRARSQEKTS